MGLTNVLLLVSVDFVFLPFFFVTLPFGLCVFLLFKVGWACVCFPSPLLGPIYFPPLFHFNKLYLP